MIFFQVNDKLPGDQIDLANGGTVTINAHAYGHQQEVPLSKLEIVAHGKVIKEVITDGLYQNKNHLSIKFDLAIEKGIWVAARCYAGPTQIAHTTPVYISINKSGFHNDETIQDYLALNEKYLDELESELNNPSEFVNQRAWWYKKGLVQRIERTREIINSLK